MKRRFSPMCGTLEPIFDRMKTTPQGAGNTRRGLTHRIGTSDWRAVMDSTQSQSGGFRTPDRWNSVPVPERVALRAYERVEVDEGGCWISTYSVGSHGYAQVGWNDGVKTRMVLAHRAAWVHVNGQMPLGMTLDHTCKVRRCVNPSHLRMLPNFENARRVSGKDWPMGQCANGHPNTLLRSRPEGGVICAPCRRLHLARHNWRRRHSGEPMPDRLLLASERQET